MRSFSVVAEHTSRLDCRGLVFAIARKEFGDLRPVARFTPPSIFSYFPFLPQGYRSSLRGTACFEISQTWLLLHGSLENIACTVSSEHRSPSGVLTSSVALLTCSADAGT